MGGGEGRNWPAIAVMEGHEKQKQNNFIRRLVVVSIYNLSVVICFAV